MKISSVYRGCRQFPLNPASIGPCSFRGFLVARYKKDDKSYYRAQFRCLGRSGDRLRGKSSFSKTNLNFIQELVKRGVILAPTVCGLLVCLCQRAFAVEGVGNVGYGVIERSILLLRNAWPTVLQVLRIFKEQGLILAVLLGLSAFFSMAETSITTLWPWKVYISSLSEY